MIKPLVAGNWKMNGLRAAMDAVQAMSEELSRSEPDCDVVICPPATLLPLLDQTLENSHIRLGAQDCHTGTSGAYTGDISAQMLKDAGASCVIVGHSERRSTYGETNAIVRAKAAAAHRAGLSAIVCVGETAGERRANLTVQVVERQLNASLPDDSCANDVIVAYEPVWAIGSGQTPAPEDVAKVHACMRRALVERFKDGDQFRLLYGGSVKPGNAAELMAINHVNGALVGGASLVSEDFLGIISYYADK
ncbi:MAG: triose-phosphate isomerase [Pseudomonadota bacterium]